jgi:hypothetical protein
MHACLDLVWLLATVACPKVPAPKSCRSRRFRGGSSARWRAVPVMPGAITSAASWPSPATLRLPRYRLLHASFPGRSAVVPKAAGLRAGRE